jgi:hypothetical protein
MTSRRGTLVEQGARELLQAQGYTVKVIPCGFDKRAPPAHLVATKATGETRFIRIEKFTHQPVCVERVELKCMHDIAVLRRYLANHPEQVLLHCEIWTYSLWHGFRPFEVGLESIREIPKLTLGRSQPSVIAGIS